METKDLKLKIKTIIVKVLNLNISPEELLEEDIIDTYGFNSVDALEVLMHIENEFEIEIDEDDLDSELVGSINKLTMYVENAKANLAKD
jgi:acyl carrier protein